MCKLHGLFHTVCTLSGLINIVMFVHILIEKNNFG